MTSRLLLAVVFLCAGHAWAHDARPAYLSIDETTPGRYAVLWRTPLSSGKPLPVALTFPAGVRDVHEPMRQQLPDSLIERRTIAADSGSLAGARIDFVGLQATITDVLVRVQLGDAALSTTLVRASRPWVEVAAAGGTFAVAAAYLAHGVEHILLGYDHLLFVLALMLIVPDRRTLIATITAFTAAHSITLALATLGLVHVPGPPVEAAIALSILLLASEIVRLRRGEPSLTARRPWLVAFAFGLLHGFGFAGALADVGLPAGDVPLALLAFNVGVECGQLAFVAALLVAAGIARRIASAARLEAGFVRIAPHAIGTLAAYWLFERLAGL